MPPSPRPRRSPARLGLDERVLGQPLGTLSGGQRRRVELSRILFSGAETLLLDEPTNHLDADSIVWLRDYLKAYKGGLIVISHDVELLDAVVNKVFHLDANRGRARRLQRRLEALPAAARDRRAAPQARARQRREEGRRPAWPRPTRCAPRPPRPSPPRTWPSAPSGCSPALEGERVQRQGRQAALPRARRRAARRRCGRRGLSRSYGSLEIFTDVDLAIDRGSRGRRARPQRRRQDDPAADARRRRRPRHRRGRAGPRAQARLLRPGAREPRRRPHASWRT